MYGSDHYPIQLQYSFSSDATAENGTVNKWLYKYGDWYGFSRYLCLNSPVLNSNIETDSVNITRSILRAAEINIPKTKSIRTKKSVPWWTLEVRLAIREYKSFWYFVRQPHNNTLENRIILKRLKAKSRRVIKIAKQSS